MKKSKIKLIIFDAYGVCLTGGYSTTCKFLAKKFRKNWKEIYNIVYTKYFNQAALKKISQDDAWLKAIKELNLPININNLKKKHYDLMGINKSVLSLASELEKNYRILLLSKNTRSQLRDINNRFPEIKKVFGKNIINTWEHNLPKASGETVEFVCERYHVKPQEIIYTDDQQSNLDVAHKMGIKTILYKNFRQFKKELNDYL